MKAREQIDAVLDYLYLKRIAVRGVRLEDILADRHLLEAVGGNKDEIERILGKLSTDKYAINYSDYPLKEDGTKNISHGLNTYFSITFEGRLFKESGGYRKEALRKNISDFPKTYWWVIAVIAFLVGLFTPTIQKSIEQRILIKSTQQQQVSPKVSDNLQNRKIQ